MKNNKLNSQPTKWPRVKLGEICDLVNGDAYRESDWNTEGVPIIRIQNLNNPNKPFNYWTGNIDDRVVVKPGDVLLAWSGTPGTSFGTHRWTRGIGILNQHIFRVDLDTTRIDPEWAVFSINEQLEEMIGRAHGAVGLRHVTKGECESLPILLPPLTEQRRLSAWLREQMAEVERARAAVQAQLDAAQILPTALLRDTFTSTAAQHWPCKKLEDVATLQRGRFSPRPRNNPIYFGGKFPFIQTGDVDLSDGYIREYKQTLNELGFAVSKMFPVGTLVISIAANIGGVGMLTFDSCMTDSLVGIQGISGVADNRFLYFVLRHLRPYLQSIAPQMAQANLSIALLGPVEINIPPLTEQKKIATRLDAEFSATRSLTQTLETRLAEIELLPAALVRSTFSQQN